MPELSSAMPLDEKAKCPACFKAWGEPDVCTCPSTDHRAYLSSLTPSPVGELVERLLSLHSGSDVFPAIHEAAASLTSLSAEVARKDAEIERLRESAKEAADLLTDLDQGRAIHNSRFPGQSIDGPLWAQVSRVVGKVRAALSAPGGEHV